MLLTLHLHAATALLALRLAPPPLHRPVEARPAVARAAGIGCMVEEPEALLVGDNTGRRRGAGVGVREHPDPACISRALKISQRFPYYITIRDSSTKVYTERCREHPLG